MGKGAANAKAIRRLRAVLWIWVVAVFGAYLVQFRDLVWPMLAILGLGT
jgi:hypothetical protein